jgi:HK97 family phage portal protein
MPSYGGGSFSVGTSAPQGFLQYARIYSTNEIVYACVDLLADSVGEPAIVGRRWRRDSPTTRREMRALYQRQYNLTESHWEANQHMLRNGFYEELVAHPLVKLLNNPNPLTSRSQFWGAIEMDKKLGGNAYAVASRVQTGPVRGAIAELWRLRPDRVKVIPKAGGIEGYEYQAGNTKVFYPESDVLHFRERNPLDDYYGMPPLLPLMGRLSIDDYMRSFLKTFFEQGGAGPGAVLALKQKTSQDLKDEIRDRFKKQFGRGGWHELLVIDQNEAAYTQMGLNRGLRDAIPKELDAVNEARISMAFRIPGSILGLLIGYEMSSYANKRQDWQVLWDLTMTPELGDLDDVLNLKLVPQFGGIDEVCFDLSDVKALQEDVDKVQERHRKNFQAGLISWEECREAIGRDPELSEGTLLIPTNMTPITIGRLEDAADTEPVPPPTPALPVATVAEVHCPKCGRWVGRNMNVGAVAYCPKDKEVLVTLPGEEPKVVSISVVRDDDGRVAQLVGEG